MTVHASTLSFLFGTALTLGAVTGCTQEASEFGDFPDETADVVGEKQQLSSVAESACNQDPRVWAGLVPFQVCAGARVFFDETFNGNGRTCGSCHPAENNYTIDLPFLATLDSTDALFAGEGSTTLANLETAALRSRGLIRENVDDFSNNDHKFVLRSVPHLFALGTSIERDAADGTSATFTQRTGWSGDGVDGGALRDFANGAIKQHFPTNLARVPGRDFREATGPELDQMLAFQVALGRSNELNLSQVVLTDSFAEQGRKDFLDPQVGRCNECHENAGAKSVATHKNTNFANGIEVFAPFDLPRPTLNGVELQDGGFGGQGLTTPNVIAGLFDAPNAFGDNSFNTPSLVEVGDTGPFFHHNGVGEADPARGMAGAIAFYASDAFNDSPAGKKLTEQFGSRVTLPGNAIINIQQFLRVVNVAFNFDLTTQRLKAAELLNVQYWNYREDLQRGLIDLARAEVLDAQSELVTTDAPPLHPELHATVVGILQKLADAKAASTPDQRLARVRSAISQIAGIRGQFGTKLQFNLGSGTLMF